VELYLVEGIEQFQSPEIESHSLEIQVNNDKNQVGNEETSVRGINMLLPSGSSLPLIIISNITDENVVRREIDTSTRRKLCPSQPAKQRLVS
jgi:hypothetical protein